MRRRQGAGRIDAGADLFQLALQLLPEDVLEQGNVQMAVAVFQDRQGNPPVLPAFQGNPEADPAPVGDGGQGQHRAPGLGRGELAVGPLGELQEADDSTAIDGQEGVAAVGVEQELLQGLEPQVQGGEIVFMEPEQGRPALAEIFQGAGRRRGRQSR